MTPRLTLESVEFILDSDCLASILQVFQILVELFCNLHQSGHDIVTVRLVSKGSLDANALALFALPRCDRVV